MQHRQVSGNCAVHAANQTQVGQGPKPPVDGDGSGRRASDHKSHFIPTHLSWLNQAERFFAELTRKRLQRESFSSIFQLRAGIHDHLKKPRRFPSSFQVDCLRRPHPRQGLSLVRRTSLAGRQIVRVTNNLVQILGADDMLRCKSQFLSGFQESAPARTDCGVRVAASASAKGLAHGTRLSGAAPGPVLPNSA